MSLQTLFKFLDAPFAIVVGGVAAVMIVLQLGAVGWLAQSQVDRAAQRESQVRQVRMEKAHCLGAAGVEAFAACRQAVVASRTDSVVLR